MLGSNKRAAAEIAREERAAQHRARMALPLEKRQRLNLERRVAWESGRPVRQAKRAARLEGYRLKNKARKTSRVIA